MKRGKEGGQARAFGALPRERQKRQERHAGEIIPPAPPCFCLPASPVRQDSVTGMIMRAAVNEGGGEKKKVEETKADERAVNQRQKLRSPREKTRLGTRVSAAKTKHRSTKKRKAAIAKDKTIIGHPANVGARNRRCRNANAERKINAVPSSLLPRPSSSRSSSLRPSSERRAF